MTDKSVTKRATKSKRLVQTKASLSIYNGGIKFKRHLQYLTSVNTTSRGKITSFSYASRRRMREFLLTNDVPNCTKFGLTLTLPKHYDDIKEFPTVIKRFGNDFSKHYKKSAAVYRAELQKRGAPHLHIILFMCNDELDITSNVNWNRYDYIKHQGDRLAAYTQTKYFTLFQELTFYWCKWVANILTSVEQDYQKWFYQLGFGIGARLELLTDQGAMIRYIVDDTTKHKQEQLGYEGKQWGKFGSKNFIKQESIYTNSIDDDLNNSMRIKIGRIIGKMRRYKKYGNYPFGYKLSKALPMHRVGGITYFSESLTNRLKCYIDSLLESSETTL